MQLQFKSLRSETLYTLTIGTASGTLTGAAEPFVTQEADDADMFLPIRTQTGYIRIGGFTEGLGADFRGRVKDLRKQGMDKLVVDLRGNGGGLMNEAVNIVSAFVPKGSLVVSLPKMY